MSAQRRHRAPPQTEASWPDRVATARNRASQNRTKQNQLLLWKFISSFSFYDLENQIKMSSHCPGKCDSYVNGRPSDIEMLPDRDFM